MNYMQNLIGTAAVVAVIAVAIVLTFTLARKVDGEGDSAPIVQGEPVPLG